MSGGAADIAGAESTARRHYFPAVEGMRGVAALLVLFGHTLYFTHSGTGWIARVGAWIAPLGVVVFFVISGFLLYRPFVAARAAGPSVGAIVPMYLVRRVVRILPAYWVALTLLSIWPGVYGVFSGHWWVDYGLLQVYSVHWQPTGLGVAWTLCVEFTFYLVLPFVALLLHDRGLGRGAHPRREVGWELGVLGGLAFLSMAWRGYAGAHSNFTYLEQTLPNSFGWFCGGMLLAAVQVSAASVLPRVRRAMASPWLCWPLAVGLFFFLLEGLAGRVGLPPTVALALVGVASGLFGVCLVGPAVLADGRRAVRALFANRVIIYLGTISYGIYLYHHTILDWVLTTSWVAESQYPVLTVHAVVLVSSVALGTASWYLVEKPLMRRVRSVKAYADLRRKQLEAALPEEDDSAGVERQGSAGEPLPSPQSAA